MLPCSSVCCGVKQPTTCYDVGAGCGIIQFVASSSYTLKGGDNICCALSNAICVLHIVGGFVVIVATAYVFVSGGTLLWTYAVCG